MEEIIPCFIVIVVAVAVLSLRRNKLTPHEERFVLAAFGLHVLFSIGFPWLFFNYMGGGDMVGYAAHGRELASAMAQDFFGFAPEVVKLVLQLDGAYLENGTGGTSTGSMSAMTAFPMLLLDGSTYASGMVFSFLAFSGGITTYRVFRDSFPESYRTRMLWATLLVPSVICWSSGLMKEAVVMGPFGWTIYAIHSFNRGKRIAPILLAAFSTVLIAVIKPYVLVPLAGAGMVWIYWHRATAGSGGRAPTLRPIYLVAAFVGAAAAVAVLGSIFPDYSVDNLGEQTARYQELGEQAGGGSVIEMGDSTRRSLGGQLAFAPLALISSLFRPFIFEARNALMIVAALETTVLLVIVLRTIWQRSWRKTLAIVWASPVLMFSLVFTLLFGVAVGLVTLNLGTLSRYRMPLMPLYVALIAIISKDEQSVQIEDAESDEKNRERTEARLSPRAISAMRRR